MKDIAKTKKELIGEVVELRQRVGELEALEEKGERTKETLKELEEQYRQLVELSPDTIAVHSEGKIVFINSAGVKLLRANNREQLLGKSIMDLLHPDYRQEVNKRIRVARQNQTKAPLIEEKFIRLDGTTVDVEVAAVAITWHGKPAIQAIARDITERKQAEEKEKQLQQELNLASRLATVGEMASGIAHEVNNPLTGVVGFAGLLLKKDIPEDIRHDVNTIYEGAQRIASITERMLTFAGQHKPRRTSVNINDIIETTLAMRAYEMESSNIKVTTQLASDMPLTSADAGQLQQIFLNIILNAEMEMGLAHGRGNLTVKTERIDDTIWVSFKDDGPGILKKNLERIFDPFFTTREVGQGAGMGLSVSHGIVTQHGGKIYAQSIFGKGATLIVELPIITKAEQLKFAEPTAGEVKRVSAARILVVDDDSIVQQFLTEVLGEEGDEVEIIENGEDALERLGSEDYDVILLDVKLPGISGIDLYKYMQRSIKSLARRVIFITCDVMSKDTMSFLSKTRVPYITKPFDAEQLKKDIDHILSQQS